MKKRVLTGIQSSGVPHLGNILGAILPAIKLSQETNTEALLFIADMHSLTTLKDANTRQHNTYSVAAAWLAFGFDIEKNLLYRQSRVPQVTELTWYLSCFTPFPMLANAHSFKDKSNKLADVNCGLFTYPVLMAADILLYNAHEVPVGKDQLQHLEITRDIAHSFNHQYGETFVVPKPKIEEEVMIVPGTDGNKMSKSYNNFIDIFLPEKELEKQIKKIVTDSIPVEEPKEAENCNVYKLYKLVATEQESVVMKENYAKGGYGYGHAKKELYNIILEKFKQQRLLYNQYIGNKSYLEEQLLIGEKKASFIANETLATIRTKLGFE
jgi:tryptophanyl-tRNA synthetase